MFGTMGKAPGMNGGMRDSRGRDDDDDDDDEDVGGQFKKDSISLDQVGYTTTAETALTVQARRIATQSVFRAGRLG